MIQFISSLPSIAITGLIVVFAVLWLIWIMLYASSDRNNPH